MSKYISDKARSIIEKIASTKIEVLFSYERLLFSVLYQIIKNSGNFTKEELSAIKKGFHYCANSKLKIEGVSRYRRVLTGVTKGEKGKYYEPFQCAKAKKNVKKLKKELGYNER